MFEMEYDSVAHRLPEPLEFLSDPPTGTILCSSASFVSDSSPFLEANLIYQVQYKGKPYNYITNLFVNSGEAMIAGREVYGYAKKLADMEYYTDKGQICMTVERPRGFRIFSASVRTKRPKQMDPANIRDVLLLKVIPSPIIGDPPQVCMLVGIDMSARANAAATGAVDTWECSGSISWGVTSSEDPWSQTKITKIIDAYYSMQGAAGFGPGGGLASGYIVHDYLK
jgi:acetoacetate decarboxylase